MNKPEIYSFDDNPSVARAFAECMQAWLAKRFSANIALSGGSTPNLLFRELAKHYKSKIDWTQVRLFWVDERCVPPDDEQSNYGTARALLLDHIGIPETHIHRMRGEAEPEAEVERYSGLLTKHLHLDQGIPVFDLILLGMGSDGHTASIFPDQMDLLESAEICTVATHPESGQRRITLTGKTLNRARHVSFLVTGASKAEKVGEVLGEGKAGANRYPAGHIHPHGRLTWWIDKAAGAALDPKLIRTGRLAI